MGLKNFSLHEKTVLYCEEDSVFGDIRYRNIEFSLLSTKLPTLHL